MDNIRDVPSLKRSLCDAPESILYMDNIRDVPSLKRSLCDAPESILYMDNIRDVPSLKRSLCDAPESILYMDNIIKYMVDDLSTYSSKDINTLARYHNIPNDLQMIARHNLKDRRARATMYGKTYDTNQISEVVNMLNSHTKSNICLRTALVVTRYTDKKDIFYNSIPLNIKHQKYDIYKDTPDEKTEAEIPGPYVMIQDIYKAHKKASRYCFFVIWVTKDGFDKNLPVIESHITLTICDKIHGSPNTFVYKYNSGYSNDESEQILDNDIKYFLSLITEIDFKFINTPTWCPKSIQGTSNMCTVFVFNIYYYCNRYRQMPVKDIIESKVQAMSNILIFLKEDLKNKGAGKHDIYTG